MHRPPGTRLLWGPVKHRNYFLDDVILRPGDEDLLSVCHTRSSSTVQVAGGSRQDTEGESCAPGDSLTCL